MKKLLLCITIATVIFSAFSACSSRDEEEFNWVEYVQVHTSYPTLEGLFDIVFSGKYWILKGNFTITEAGFCWVEEEKQSEYPTRENNYVQANIEGDEFNVTINGLTEGTYYMVRAYVKVGDEYIYDHNPAYFHPFRASLYLPKLEQMGFSTGGYYKETNRCYINGLCKITAASRLYPVETCGVCYGKSSNPTIEESDVIMGEIDKDGYMRIYIGDLDPSVDYYFRAWATNEAGLAYSEELKYFTYIGD